MDSVEDNQPYPDVVTWFLEVDNRVDKSVGDPEWIRCLSERSDMDDLRSVLSFRVAEYPEDTHRTIRKTITQEVVDPLTDDPVITECSTSGAGGDNSPEVPRVSFFRRAWKKGRV